MRNEAKEMISKRRLIFLHVPKTGGSTMRHIVSRQYSAGAVFTIGVPAPEAIAAFKQLPRERRDKIDVLQGHMGFGLHRYLHGPCVYFTMLRDPIDRVVSRYYYEVSKTPRPAYMHRGQDETSGALTLEEYVRSGINKLVDNGMTRLLSASDGKIYGVPFGQCSRSMLGKAIENLEKHFLAPGILAQFDESLILLRRAMGWRLPLYLRRRVTRRRPEPADISESARQTVLAFNELDIELYDWGRQSLKSKIDEQGPGFHAEVVSFGLLNRVLGRTYALVRSTDNRSLRGSRAVLSRQGSNLTRQAHID
jgi:hypothetical protein